MNSPIKPINVLLVEDNAGDARLIKEALLENKLSITIDRVTDGIEALEYLRNEGQYKSVKQPELILLDLNMPRMDGRELLEIIKKDKKLKMIPVVILTTSSAEEDILRSYELHANAYVTKPVDLDQFIKIVHELEAFWFTIVRLPLQET